MVNLLTIFGSVSLSVGGIGYFAFPAVVSLVLRAIIDLAENGIVYSLYMYPPFGTQTQMHLLEIANPREVLRGAKIKFKLKGPYNYKTDITRDNIAYSQSDQLVRFDSHRKLHPREEVSADFDESMWMLNPVPPTALKLIRSIVLDRIPFQNLVEPIALGAVNVLLNNYREHLIVRTTPRQFLNGRKVGLLELVSDLAARFGLSALMPAGLPQNIFGIALLQNETADRIELYTGTGASKDKFAEVFSWKDKMRVEAFSGKCGTITGTNGELHKPLIKTGHQLRVFLSPLCRSSTLVPVSEEPVKTNNGLNAWNYELNSNLFAGAKNVTRNLCYCEDPRTYDCQYDGLMAMGPCLFAVPIFFARVNFKGADRRIKQTTDYEDFSIHQVPQNQSFVIDQSTGITLSLNLSIMAVMKVVKQTNVRDMARIKNLSYVPFFIQTETLEIPLLYAWPIYLLERLNNYYKSIMVCVASLGALALVSGMLFG